MSTTPDPIRESVRERYAERARTSTSCCGPDDCDCGNSLYDVELLADLPTDVTQFSLGCGNPISLAALQPGEIVVDLGSGGGLDCFLAARAVGAEGRAIGIDMTPEMLERARSTAARLGVANVEFRQGYLEALPLPDNSADVVLSNCVINLSPDKLQVFREIARVLRFPDPAADSPGGRLAVADIVTRGVLPEAVQRDLEAWGACVAGALDVDDYERGLAQAGFTDIQIVPQPGADPSLEAFAAGQVFSANITARKSGARPG
jgi:SAM-dependent methyltransferase